ncbi:hypothetical protein DV737_g4458, partial [Chaetothyriales sp. CBS 132003]
MGKRGGFKKGGRGRGGASRGGGGDRGPRRDNRTDKASIVRRNDKFEHYYNSLAVVANADREDFWAAMQRDLPNSFRFTGSKGHALAVQQRLKDYYIPEITSITFDGDYVPAPKPVEWYPDQLAWYMTTPKQIIRRFAPFKSFQTFLVAETDVGNITRQEIVSMIPPLCMDVKPWHTVLDLCAAPGSKSAQLIEMLHAGEEDRARETAGCVANGQHRARGGAEFSDDGRSTGLLIANDVDYKRAHMLVHQVKRLSSPNIVVTNHDATIFPSIKMPAAQQADGKVVQNRYLKFDRILADVPCSGDGTVRKNVEIWQKWNPANGLGLHAIQVRILMRALQMLKVGGRVVYSTCSMNPVEDEAVVATAVARCGGADVVEIIDTNNYLPGLQRSAGMKQWSVMDKTGRIWNDYESVAKQKADAGEEGLGRLQESMFPPKTEVNKADSAKAEGTDSNGIAAKAEGTGSNGVAAKPEAAPSDTANSVQSNGTGPSKRERDEDQEAPAAKRARAGEEDARQTNEQEHHEQENHEQENHEQENHEQTNHEQENHEQENHEQENHEQTNHEQTNHEQTNHEQENHEQENHEQQPHEQQPHEQQPHEQQHREQAMAPAAEPESTPAGAKVGPAKERTRRDQPFEEPFKYLEPTNEALEAIFKFYSIDPRFPRDRFLVRNAQGTATKNIYYTTALARDMLTENEGKGMKFVHAGVKMFVKQDAPNADVCPWRIQTDGLRLIEPWVGAQRRVRLWKKATLRKLLIEMFPRFHGEAYKDLGEVGEQVKDLGMGCCVLVVEPREGELSERMVFPLWKSVQSLNLMLPKEERKAMLLRIFNDQSDLVNLQQNPGGIRRPKEGAEKAAAPPADNTEPDSGEAAAAALPTDDTEPNNPDPSTVHLPRILCLHGGGVNSVIFRTQLRAFLAHPLLSSRYRFVFVDAPFACDEGVGVYPVYADWGPFKRWSRWLTTHPTIEPADCQAQIWAALEAAMHADSAVLGATGAWVGVLGFSQGAKLACSLLYEQQLAQLRGERPRTAFQMGLVFAGRAPFLALGEQAESFPWMQSAGGVAEGVDLDSIDERPDLRLSVPTLHVHGLKDEGLDLHRRCVDGYCAPGTWELVEWDGPHRLPIKKGDVERVVAKWMEMADEYGI